jgi:hypothetical protein
VAKRSPLNGSAEPMNELQNHGRQPFSSQEIIFCEIWGRDKKVSRAPLLATILNAEECPTYKWDCEKVDRMNKP